MNIFSSTATHPEGDDSLFRIVFSICHLVGMSSALVNPIIYGFFNQVKIFNILVFFIPSLPIWTHTDPIRSDNSQLLSQLTSTCTLTDSRVIKYSQGFRKAFTKALSCNFRGNNRRAEFERERTTHQTPAKFWILTFDCWPFAIVMYNFLLYPQCLCSNTLFTVSKVFIYLLFIHILKNRINLYILVSQKRKWYKWIFYESVLQKSQYI